MSNLELTIDQIKKGDIQSFELIIEKYQRSLFIYCFGMLNNIQETEDAVQDIFIKAYEKLNSYSYSVSFSAWLYKISYNHCINIIRRKKLIKFIPFIDFNDAYYEDRDYENKYEISKELQMALSNLSIEDRILILSKVLENKSYEELSIMLGKSQATIRKRYERARKKLTQSLNSIKGDVENEKCATS